MKKLIIISLLSLYFIGGYAQSLDELKGKSKITEIEKRNKEYRKTSISIRKSYGGWDVDNDTWGISYSYSSAFPAAISVCYTSSYFYIGGELGVNFEKKKYTLKESKNLLKVGDPKCYISVNPGVYVKYLSLSCGIGVIVDSREETNSFSTSGENESGSTGITVAGSSFTSTTGGSLFIKPNLTGYIPLNDEFSLTLNVGYNLCPKFKDLNGISFAAGLQITID